MKTKFLLTLSFVLILSMFLIGCTEEDPLANVEVEKTNETVEYILPETDTE